MKTSLKKNLFLATIFILFSVFFSLRVAPSASAFTGTCREFIGLTSWDCGVDISNQSSLQNGVWQIAVNILTDITVIAAYLVIAYVIYGGYLYTFSSGDPSKVAKGKKALTQAFIGLAIVMSASAIMSTIRFAMLGAKGALNCDPLTGANCAKDGSDLILSTIHWFIAIAGIVSAIFVVYGGISYTTSAGDPGKLQKAKSMIIYALIGLVIVALAETITAFVSNMIREANDAALIKNNSISKEIHEKTSY